MAPGQARVVFKLKRQQLHGNSWGRSQMGRDGGGMEEARLPHSSTLEKQRCQGVGPGGCGVWSTVPGAELTPQALPHDFLR